MGYFFLYKPHIIFSECCQNPRDFNSVSICCNPTQQRKKVDCCLQKIARRQQNGKTSKPRWCVPGKAGLVVALEGSAEVMGWWLLLWEWGIALHLMQKGCFSLFGISRITVPDFREFSF